MSGPPTSLRAAQIELLLSAFKTVLEDRSAVYVSAPITTGRRFAQWRLTLGEDDLSPSLLSEQHREAVVAPNILEARATVSAVRRKFPSKVVIDPTALPDIKDWEQSDYRHLWRSVIERFAELVVFVD